MVRSVTAVLAALALPPVAATHAQERTVYLIRVAGSVEVDLSDLVGATLQAAEREPGSLVVLDIGSSGGRMDIAQLIVDDLQRTSVPVYALVSGRAWQAAALLALAGDSIFVVADVKAIAAHALLPHPVASLDSPETLEKSEAIATHAAPGVNGHGMHGTHGPQPNPQTFFPFTPHLFGGGGQYA